MPRREIPGLTSSRGHGAVLGAWGLAACGGSPSVDTAADATGYEPQHDVACADGVAAWLDGATSWSTVQAALDAAGDGGSTVTVCPGTHELSWSGAGALRVESLTGAADTILQAPTGSPLLVQQADDDDALGFAGLTLQGTDSPSEDGGLGCVVVDGYNEVHLSHCELRRCAGLEGGGLHAVFSRSVVIEHSSFTDNEATEGDGGAVLARYLTVRDSSFQRNTAAERGGAVRAVRGLALEDVELRDNDAPHGGGLWTGGDDSDDSDDEVYTLTRVLFEDNTATLHGGGLTATQVSLTLDDVRFHANAAGEDGGAISFSSSDDDHLTCTACDLGAGSQDNTPTDLFLHADGSTWDFDADASFVCSSTGCG